MRVAAVVLAALANVLSACGSDDSARAACEVSVFMRPDATAAQTDTVGDHIRTLVPEAKVHFVDRAEAYREYQRLFRDDEDLNDIVSEADMPTSFRISQLRRGDGPRVRRALGTDEGVDKVAFDPDCE